ncbi:MAG TPA: hypothetical protein VLL05_18460 [Terriglobales bacterium]|nr:hypothetical protein [Terriglobales bacterium]
MARMIYFHTRPKEAKPVEPFDASPLQQPAEKRRDWRLAVYVVALAVLLLIALIEFAHAGGPEYVAGSSYFDTGLAGQPVTWPNGGITYYTDLGNLSPILAGSDADAFVADAFSRWTSISTAAVSATRGGQLAEDVNGLNVIFNSDRTITMPADIRPTATTKPVAIVYDADGAVTDALIGYGASTDCFTNAAFGGIDAFTTDGHFAHALVILDGRCAMASVSLPDVKYRLVRVLGQVFGVGWSQLNLNVLTGIPQATTDDLAGFPTMHSQDLPSCAPISACYPAADQPKMDDRAALARLYPVTSDNLALYPGKQVFAASTGRVHGSVYFTDAIGNPAQPMQGVNVVRGGLIRERSSLRDVTRHRRCRSQATQGMPLPDSTTHLDSLTTCSDRVTLGWRASSIWQAWKFPAVIARSTSFLWSRWIQTCRGMCARTLRCRCNRQERRSRSS